MLSTPRIMTLTLCLALASCAKKPLETPPPFIPKLSDAGDLDKAGSAHGGGGKSANSPRDRPAEAASPAQPAASSAPSEKATSNASPVEHTEPAQSENQAKNVARSSEQKNDAPPIVAVKARSASASNAPLGAKKNEATTAVDKIAPRASSAPSVASPDFSKVKREPANKPASISANIPASTQSPAPASAAPVTLEPAVAASREQRTPQTLSVALADNSVAQTRAGAVPIQPSIAASPRTRESASHPSIDWLEKIAGAPAKPAAAADRATMSRAEAIAFLRQSRASHVAVWTAANSIGLAIAREEALRQIEQGDDVRFVVTALAEGDSAQRQREADTLAASLVPADWLQGDAAEAARRERLARRAANQDADRAGRDRLQASVYDFLLGDRAQGK